MADMKPSIPADQTENPSRRPFNHLQKIWLLVASRYPSRAWVAVSAMLVLVALFAFGIWQGFQVSAGVDKAGQAVVTLESLNVSDTDLREHLENLPTLHGTLSQANDQLKDARSNLKLALPFTPLIGWIPSVGAQAKEGKDLLDLGEEIVQGSLDLLLSLEKAAAVSNGPVMLEGRQLNTTLLQSITASEPDLQAALDHFTHAETIQEKLSAKDLPADLNRLLSFSENIVPELKGLAQMGLAMSQSWSSFLGFEEPRTYLLVAQNTDELRGSGGYLPGAWLLELNQGRIERLQFWDTVDVDDLEAGLPTPPGGIVQSLWGGVWLFRDASWSPNFPSSARVMEQLFRLGTGHSVDGVIAVDQWAVKEILEAIGPVTLPDGQEVGADSYLRTLEEGKDEVGRVFMDTTLNGMMDGLGTNSSTEKFAALMLALKRSLDQGHLLPNFHDTTLQQHVIDNSWSGKLSGSTSDYLMVVDSNVGWNKVNRNIEREMEYLVALEPGGISQARLDISYTNTSTPRNTEECSIQTPSLAGTTYAEKKNGCYWDYLRVYVPLGSTIQSASPFPMPEGAIYRRLGYNDIEDTLQTFIEEEKTVFSGFFNLAPEESRQVTFLYELSADVLTRQEENWSYSLVVEKQPGLLPTATNVTVSVPGNYVIEDAVPHPTKLSEHEARFELLLDSSATIELTLKEAN